MVIIGLRYTILNFILREYLFFLFDIFIIIIIKDLFGGTTPFSVVFLFWSTLSIQNFYRTFIIRYRFFAICIMFVVRINNTILCFTLKRMYNLYLYVTCMKLHAMYNISLNLFVNIFTYYLYILYTHKNLYILSLSFSLSF